MPLRFFAAVTRLARRLALALLVAGFLSPVGAAAQNIDLAAEQAILIDMSTDTVLYERKADERMPTSSMGKMITIYELFKRLDDGRLSLDDTFTVSEKAWNMGGSKMFVEVGESVTVEELLHGIIVSSGNDASVVAAEGIAGTEGYFAEQATQTARDLGMADTNFANASGWPEENQYSTARDLAKLAMATIRNFPELYDEFYNDRSFAYNGIEQSNRNPLLGYVRGADGLKTGHTEAAGYGLAGSVKRGERRLVFVVNGLPSKDARKRESEKLVEWGFREFETYQLFEAGETVVTAETWLGEPARVDLIIENPLQVTLHRTSRPEMTVRARHQEPVEAPVTQGATVGTVTVEAPGLDTIDRPLVASEAVEQLGPFGRIGAAAQHLLWGEAG